ncbi:MAG: hypothetical protein ACQKBY_12725 [Verrucomicrobiales bacterium]
MTRLPQLLAFLLVIATQTGVASAQKISVRTLFIGPERPPATLHMRGEEKDLGELKIATQQIGDAQALPARRFVLGRLESAQFTPLAEVELPEAGKHFILLLFPRQNGYHVETIRSDDPAFRPASVRFFNLTQRRIGLELGSVRDALAPGENKLIQLRKNPDAPFIQTRFYSEKNGRPVLFSNSRWPVSERLRHLIFIYQSPEHTQPRYHAVSDLAPQP